MREMREVAILLVVALIGYLLGAVAASLVAPW
jgi:hypothetical protein